MSENGEYRSPNLAILAPCYRLGCLFSRSARPRPPLRRPIFHRCCDHGDLLPPNLPGTRAEAREHALFFERGGGGGRGIQAMPALPPERAPGLAAVDAAGRLIGAAIAGIEEHALSNARVGDLAASLGVSDRHLRRVTEAELGVSPIELAQTQRLLLAKRLLNETSLNLTDIAFASGFGSLRRFNALFKSRYGLNPRRVRGSLSAPRALSGAADALHCQLDFRPPLAWPALLDYLRLRAIPGVEWADRTHYRRTVAIALSQKGDACGWVAVSLAKSGMALDVEMSPSLAPVIGAVIVRVKNLFDLGAAPDSVSALLSQDRMLARVVRRAAGIESARRIRWL